MFMRHDYISDCILVSYSDVNASEPHFFKYPYIFNNIYKCSYNKPDQLAQIDISETVILLYKEINTHIAESYNLHIIYYGFNT